jgi:hypothetical protein
MILGKISRNIDMPTFHLSSFAKDRLLFRSLSGLLTLALRLRASRNFPFGSDTLLRFGGPHFRGHGSF